MEWFGRLNDRAELVRMESAELVLIESAELALIAGVAGLLVGESGGLDSATVERGVLVCG